MNSGLDRWVQRMAIAAMVALAAGLVLLGVLLYAPHAQAQTDLRHPARGLGTHHDTLTQNPRTSWTN